MEKKLFICLVLCEFFILAHSVFWRSGKTRRYYIAAVEVDWNYAPDGFNLVTEDISVAATKLNHSEDRIGAVYRKVIYRQFTDESFENEISSPPYMGYLGPIMRAEIGDTLEIHFKNLASGRNYSMHPHGVLYDKLSEGALYVDGTNQTHKLDDGVPPNGSHIYTWEITKNFGPTAYDENCVSWAYHSHVSSVKDINTGLVGCLLTCRQGILNKRGFRKDVDKDFVIYTEIVDENESWKILENLNKCDNTSNCLELHQLKESGFIGSNRMPAINGYMFGNLPDLSAREGDTVAWHFMGMNEGMRGVTINGQTFSYRRKRLDTISIFPATFVSAIMKVTSPGRWLLQSRTTNEYEGGMQAFFTVVQNYRRYLYQKRRRPKIDQKFFLAAEESDWDYGPTGTDTIDGTDLLANGSFSKRYFKKGPKFIGGIYKKVRYVQYTDCKFQTKMKPSSDSEHLGVLGPMLRVAVGQKIQVTFRNLASRNYSFLPHGVQLDKDQEGALYRGSPLSTDLTGKFAAPGETVTYTFTVPWSVSPTGDDPMCNTYVYHSAVDPVRDIHSGLMGPLLVCKAWSLDKHGRQKHVEKDFAIFYLTIDENKSWYIDDNIRVHTEDPGSVNKEDPEFVASNRMHSINGRMYGNLKGLDMCVGDDVTWHVASVGDFVSMHGTYFHGNTMKIDGSNRASKVVIPGSSFTGEMTPDNAGDWQIVCRTNFHFRTGMRVQYHVHDCNGYHDVINDAYWRGATRHYYIAAVNITWDYAPGNMDLITSHNLSDPNINGHLFVRTDNGFLGSTREKVVYREYTDETFSTMKVRTPEEEHLGILGPVIKAEIWDTIIVTFRNFAGRPYSIHAHGVYYDQNDDGVLQGKPSDDAENTVNDGTGNGDQVYPGRTHTYTWRVPRRAGPAKDYREPNCVTWIYYSGVDTIKDMNTGLVGPLVVCRRGTLVDGDTTRRDVDREFALLFNVMDENESWLLSENIQKYGSNETNLNDTQFKLSNEMNMINGKIYGNLHGLNMEIDETIAWYILGLGSSFDIHTVHFHGQTFLHRDNVVHRGDVIEVFPGTYETIEMKTDNPGVWILHCHLNDHINMGMEATYNITEQTTHRGNNGFFNWLG
ncbi:hephaestin-like protein [Ylistrum balloti]|uniref:hephaestin-like protein n=1 Tax=Ylistrum balloti TaxID=509963 RepID=UPI002905A256|nr:hephaestin-like protein [Ylistrum balloti]